MLEPTSMVAAVTNDNKKVAARCVTGEGGEATLVLLPRVRYSLPVAPVRPEACAAANELFFEQGILIVPTAPNADGFINHVVAMNLSERVVRLDAGTRLFRS